MKEVYQILDYAPEVESLLMIKHTSLSWKKIMEKDAEAPGQEEEKRIEDAKLSRRSTDR